MPTSMPPRACWWVRCTPPMSPVTTARSTPSPSSTPCWLGWRSKRTVATEHRLEYRDQLVSKALNWVREGMAMAGLTRRALMLRTGELAGAGLVLPLLAACSLVPRSSSAPTTGGGGAKSGKVTLPVYVPVQDGPKADLPPRADGVDAGYFSFPQTLFKSVKQKAGNGEDVTLMTNIIQGAVVALDQNSAWQAVNADMGLTVRQRLYGSGDYRNGLATTIAGGDLPDTIYNPPQKYIS